MFCLPKIQADEFKARLKDGTIDPKRLIDMTSEARRAFFEEIVGKDNAVNVNAGFEKNIIAKHQQDAMIKWAKELTGIKPEVKNDILARILKTRKVGVKGEPIGPVPLGELLQPEELDLFLQDLAAKRLGVRTTAEQAKMISDLAKNVETARAARKPDGTFDTPEERMRYGYAQVDFQEYVDFLKIQAESRTAMEVLKDVYKKPFKSLYELSGLSKALKATLDVSGLLNQGLNTLLTSPTKWYANTLKTFEDIWKVGRGRDAMRDLKAQVFSHPEFDTFKKGDLAMSGIEEAFPTSLPERIYGVGRVFKAAETAYTGMMLRNRIALAEIALKQARRAGVDVTDKEELKAMFSVVNSVTGRAGLGKAEILAKEVNAAFFSLRFLKSHFDVLFDPLKAQTPFARKLAAKNLLRIFGTLSIFMLAMNAMRPGSFEMDPRSANAGKLKIGSSYFDVTGGMGSVVTLLARILTLSTKSTTTGQVKSLTSGDFGVSDGVDVVNDFFQNKLSPLAGIGRDYLRGHDLGGNKLTPGRVALNLFEPLPFQSYRELANNPDSAGPLLGMIIASTGLNLSERGGSSYEIYKDKPLVVSEVFKMMADGDKEGAKALAHEFNVDLRAQLETEAKKKTPDADPNDLAAQVDKKWKANAIYMPSDEDVRKYKNGDTDVVQSISDAGKPKIKEDVPVPASGIIGSVITYAHAIGVDPATAFNDIFKGQIIRRVDNGAVIVYRMSVEDSERIKKEGGGDNETMKLDHTVPLQLSGNNERSNLKLVPTAEWETYTPVENYLGRGLRAKRIDKDDAVQAIKDFKNGTITFDEIKKKFPE